MVLQGLVRALMVMVVAQSCPTLRDPIAYQAPLSMGFSRQENWSGLPFPSPGDLPDPGLNLGLLHWRQMLYCLSHKGSNALKRKESHSVMSDSL